MCIGDVFQLPILWRVLVARGTVIVDPATRGGRFPWYDPVTFGSTWNGVSGPVVLFRDFMQVAGIVPALSGSREPIYDWTRMNASRRLEVHAQ